MKDEKKKDIVIAVLFVIIILLICCLIVVKTVKKNDETKKSEPLNSLNETNNNVNDSQNDTTNNNDSVVSNYISKEEAINIALNDAKLQRSSIYDLDIELENDYGKTVYEISFEYNSLEYEYLVDANESSIVNSNIKRD